MILFPDSCFPPVTLSYTSTYVIHSQLEWDDEGQKPQPSKYLKIKSALLQYGLLPPKLGGTLGDRAQGALSALDYLLSFGSGMLPKDQCV